MAVKLILNINLKGQNAFKIMTFIPVVISKNVCTISLGTKLKIPGTCSCVCKTVQGFYEDVIYTGNSRSLALDLCDQYDGLEKTGQFRFTPPTHCMLAFCQAIKEFEQEGGMEGRAKR